MRQNMLKNRDIAVKNTISKNSKGITLIALVITVVVLLILAGVSISAITGNESAMEKAKQARSKNEQGGEEDAIKIAVVSAMSQNTTTYGMVEEQYLTPELAKIGATIVTAESNETEFVVEVTATHRKYKITKAGIVTQKGGLSLNKSSISFMEDGDSTDTLTATLDGISGTINWSSSDDNIASVSGNGNTATVTKGATYGTATITATLAGDSTKTDTCTVSNVKKVSSIILGQDSISLGAGETSEAISITKEPSENAEEIEVVSNNSAVATAIINNAGKLVITGVGSGEATITVQGKQTNTVKDTITVTVTVPSYVGCYADLDGNGSVDGIIFADLLAQKPTGNWVNTDGAYTLTTVSAANVKTYTKSTTKVTDARFEKSSAEPSTYTERYLVSLANNNTGTEDRFYVMGLNDIKAGTYSTLYWYKNANGQMSELVTTNNFGAGKTNTTNMIAKWNAEGYGTKNTTRDMWGFINVGTGEANEDWFVPSKAEWAAFAKAFNLSNSSSDDNYYKNYGLSDYYWSSSQNSATNAWSAGFINGCMSNYDVNDRNCVRLATTF